MERQARSPAKKASSMVSALLADLPASGGFWSLDPIAGLLKEDVPPAILGQVARNGVPAGSHEALAVANPHRHVVREVFQRRDQIAHRFDPVHRFNMQCHVWGLLVPVGTPYATTALVAALAPSTGTAPP